jgi:hypothetical protein
MPFDFPNIIPPDDIRLPDALTVKQGSGPLIGRIVLEGDRMARDVGIHLKFRNNFEDLVALNRREVARGNWRALMGNLDPAKTDVSAENAFWIAGEDDDGEIVTTSGGRLYYWPGSTLADHVVEAFFGSDQGQQCVLTAPAATMLSGAVFLAASTWVRPDYRGRELSTLLPRLARAFAMARWPLDWTMAFIQRPMAESGLAAGYGSKHLSYSVEFPETPYGEIALSYTAADEIYDDFGTFLSATAGPALRKFAPRSSASLTHEVTSTSSDGVRQGSSSRS